MIKQLDDNALKNVSGGDIYKFKILDIHIYLDNVGDIGCTLRNVYVVVPNGSTKFDKDKLNDSIQISFNKNDAFNYEKEKNSGEVNYYKKDIGSITDFAPNTHDFLNLRIKGYV